MLCVFCSLVCIVHISWNCPTYKLILLHIFHDLLIVHKVHRVHQSASKVLKNNTNKIFQLFHLDQFIKISRTGSIPNTYLSNLIHDSHILGLRIDTRPMIHFQLFPRSFYLLLSFQLLQFLQMISYHYQFPFPGCSRSCWYLKWFLQI